MKNIMSSELYKVRKSKITLITGLVLLATVLLMFGMMGMVQLLIGDIEGIGMTAVDSFASFPTGEFYYVFVALFAGGLIATEYTTGTVRQVVSRGTARWKIALGQYVVLAATMTVLTFGAALLRSVVCGVIWEFGSVGAGKCFMILLGWIAVIWSYAAFSVLIAHLTRSGGLSIGINIMVLLGGDMAALILSQVTKSEFFYKYWLTSVQNSALNYEQPFIEQLGFIGILFAFGAICIGLSILLFSKRDIS